MTKRSELTVDAKYHDTGMKNINSIFFRHESFKWFNTALQVSLL